MRAEAPTRGLEAASHESWPVRAASLAATIAAASDEIESSRRLPPSLLEALHDARMFRILLPRSVGGGEADPISFVKAIEIIAGADASTAWCIGQAAGCSFSAAYLDPRTAAEIFSDRRAVVAWGPGTHRGRAVATDGGYRVTGTWMYASGSRHATWLGAHCPIYEQDGAPRLHANGKQVEKTMLFPRAAAEIEDVWQVVGLRGTGSDNYALKDHFIPEGFTYERDSDRDRREPGPLYRFGVLATYGMAFSAIALGVAQSILDSFIALASEKKPKGAATVLRESAVVQAMVGLSEARLRSSRAFLHSTIEDLWATLTRGEKLSIDQRVSLRLASTYAIHQARDVVDAAYTSAGATAIFEKNAFERRFRDMHAVSQQIQGHAVNFETVGQVRFDLGGPNPKL